MSDFVLLCYYFIGANVFMLMCCFVAWIVETIDKKRCGK